MLGASIRSVHIVSNAQLAGVTYQAGSGTDTLWVRARDGNSFGPWSTSFTVSDPPQVQTVNAGETLEKASPHRSWLVLTTAP